MIAGAHYNPSTQETESTLVYIDRFHLKKEKKKERGQSHECAAYKLEITLIQLGKKGNHPLNFKIDKQTDRQNVDRWVDGCVDA